MIAAKPFAAVALFIAIVQTAILGYMIEGRASILRSGTEVLLKTAPVDPRDLLRGDYVILTYDISTISTTSITGTRPFGFIARYSGVSTTPNAPPASIAS